MLTMEQYEHVRVADRVYGKSIHQIVRETGHARNTVRKVLRGEYTGYSQREMQPFPVLGSFIPIINGWLKSDKLKPKKHRHSARRIYHRLVEEHDFTGGETCVRTYVHHAKIHFGLTGKQVFIPLEPPVGLEAEIDWGHVRAVINGIEEKLFVFAMRSKYSGKLFIRCYRCERQLAFLDAHVHAFAFFVGIFKTLIYDNLTSAVKKVMRGHKRKLQENFVKFVSYYTFTPRFCNPAQGHEKGGVEGIIGYVRRNYFVPYPEEETLEKLNDTLLTRCLSYGGHRISGREETVDEAFQKEKEHLLALPDHRYQLNESIQCKVDKYSTVLIDKNHYSVDHRYAYHQVKVIVTIDDVSVFYGTKKIATHGRVFGSNKWKLEPDHYLDLILQRPQSFESARPLRQWRGTWPVSHEKLLSLFCKKNIHTRGIKEFIRVLQLYRDYPHSEVNTAIELAVEARLSGVSGVKHLLDYTFRPSQSHKSLPNWPTLPPADVSVYDALGGVK